LPSAVETRPVELADAKAGVSLDAGHRVVLVVNGATGSKRYRAQAVPAVLEPGAPGGVKDGKFQIEITLKAVGGTPLAHERVRIHDPDTGEPVGEAALTDENGVLRARVPEEKDYDVVVEADPAEQHELPPLGEHLGAHEPSAARHSMLSVELLDAAGAPLKGEAVHVEGDGGGFDAITDDEGCLHELAEPGVYTLTVRGTSLSAHTVFQEDRQGNDVPYRFVVR
jgi:hypothetical protein